MYMMRKKKESKNCFNAHFLNYFFNDLFFILFQNVNKTEDRQSQKTEFFPTSSSFYPYKGRAS